MPLNRLINSSVDNTHSETGIVAAGTSDQVRTVTLPSYPALPSGTIGLTLRIKFELVDGHGVTVSAASTSGGTYTVLSNHLGDANNLVKYYDVLFGYQKDVFANGDTLYIKFNRNGATTGVLNKVDVYLVAYHI